MTEETIKINDVEYVRKDTLTRPALTKAKRFSQKTELRVLRALYAFLGSDEESITEEDAVQNGATVIDPANVCMVSGKSEEAKRILARFISPDSERKELPVWSWKGDEKDQTAAFSFEYITPILKILKASNDSKVRFSLKHNHPIMLENDHFACVLAPRIESEDEQ